MVGVDGTLLSAVTELREDGRGGREGPVRDIYYQNIHINKIIHICTTVVHYLDVRSLYKPSLGGSEVCIHHQNKTSPSFIGYTDLRTSMVQASSTVGTTLISTKMTYNVNHTSAHDRTKPTTGTLHNSTGVRCIIRTSVSYEV